MDIEILLNDPGQRLAPVEVVDVAESEVEKLCGALAMALEQGFKGLPLRQIATDEEDIIFPPQFIRGGAWQLPGD